MVSKSKLSAFSDEKIWHISPAFSKHFLDSEQELWRAHHTKMFFTISD